MSLKNMGMGMDGKDGQQTLVRQPSIYSLTFDEFQSTLGSFGKDFGSMNMDEFLKNIWTAEENQAMAAALGGAPDGGSSFGAGLQRQGSLTLPRTLSQKTVDEVWRELVSAGQGPPTVVDASHQQRQPTLGEMTLEEFLVRAGVVREDLAPSDVPPRPACNSTNQVANTSVFCGDLPSANNATGLALGCPQPGQNNASVMTRLICNNGSATSLAMMATETRPYVAPMPVVNGVDMGNPQGLRGAGFVGIANAGMSNGLMPGVVGLSAAGVSVATGSPANHLLSDGLGKGTGDISSVSPVPYVFNGGQRGRKCSAVEKVMERRQRRMIKNRESAARSRARKQAYTMDLEAEVAKLKEQNRELQKKQAEMKEMQKIQVLEMINQQHGPKKLCLRRTRTGPW